MELSLCKWGIKLLLFSLLWPSSEGNAARDLIKIKGTRKRRSRKWLCHSPRVNGTRTLPPCDHSMNLSPSVRESAVCLSLPCQFHYGLGRRPQTNPQCRRFKKTVKCGFLLSVRITAPECLVRKANVDLWWRMSVCRR